jgi:hypothetical protein
MIRSLRRAAETLLAPLGYPPPGSNLASTLLELFQGLRYAAL